LKRNRECLYYCKNTHHQTNRFTNCPYLQSLGVVIAPVSGNTLIYFLKAMVGKPEKEVTHVLGKCN